MKEIEPYEIPGFKWVRERIDSGEVVSVYTNGKRLFHGGQRVPSDACHIGTYVNRRGYRLKFDFFQFLADIQASVSELEAQDATLGMRR